MKAKVIVITILAVMLGVGQVYALTTLVDLGDTTIENPEIGYTGNEEVENLDYWFEKNGIVNPDGSDIDVVADQLQAELFHTDVEQSYNLEYLGLGYAAYHSPFGVFTYGGNPFEDFDATKMNYLDPLFTQNEVEAPSNHAFTIEADTYFGFYLKPDGNDPKVTTLIAANPETPEGLDHTLFYETNKGFTMAFEDIVGGGDIDYEDLVVNLKATPEPATMLLLGLGLLGLASARKRFSS